LSLAKAYIPARLPSDTTFIRSAIIPSMCGRYRLSRRKQMIEEYFSTVSGDDDRSG
jgi:hypothetical protein